MKLSDEAASGVQSGGPGGNSGSQEPSARSSAPQARTREGEVNFSVPGTSIEKENEILATKRFI